VKTGRAAATRRAWLETMERFRFDPDVPASEAIWSPRLECCSRDELSSIQEQKLAALVPFLYENSAFYRRRFELLGLIPTDLRTVADLQRRWPVVTKDEMTQDVSAAPPYGTYTTVTNEVWRDNGWMMFTTSGSTGVPRIFRYTHNDRRLFTWAAARAMHAFGIRPTDTLLLCSGFGPHVFAWIAQHALTHMRVAWIPGGGLDASARAILVQRHRPTVLCCTPSYALHLARVMQDLGFDPAAQGVRLVFVAGEPALGVLQTRARIESLWNARMVEFYGCTEAAAHGGYSCPVGTRSEGPVFAHLSEDSQIWETVRAGDYTPTGPDERGLTVVTNLNSEGSPQLRFLMGDYTTLDTGACECGRTHVRAMGSFVGRADDLINVRGVKFFPVDIERAVRSIPGVGDEYEIVLATDDGGMDVMTVRIEHSEHAHAAALIERLQAEIRTRVEIRASAEVLVPGTLPRTEFKARRIRDARRKT
jgi:phenylacetate-CoA ligase